MPKENKKAPVKGKRDMKRKGGARRSNRPRNDNKSKDNRKEFDKEAWKPKTEIGKKVKSGEIKDIDFILSNAA